MSLTVTTALRRRDADASRLPPNRWMGAQGSIDVSREDHRSGSLPVPWQQPIKPRHAVVVDAGEDDGEPGAGSPLPFSRALGTGRVAGRRL